jgi:hypothetical protein
MTTSIFASVLALLAAFAVACGHEATDEPEVPGALEFEHSYARIYRLERRVDIFYVEDMAPERHACGILSERAFGELEETLAALDPRVDYGYDPVVDECIEGPGAWIHIEGFEHSPFSCDFLCCRRELARAALIYSFVESYLTDGEVLTWDGEPYVVIDPDQPCP